MACGSQVENTPAYPPMLTERKQTAVVSLTEKLRVVYLVMKIVSRDCDLKF